MYDEHDERYDEDGFEIRYRDDDQKFCRTCRCTYYGKHVCRGEISKERTPIHYPVLFLDELGTPSYRPYGDRLTAGFAMLHWED